ncbi:hypothetical protein D3C85_1257820 [compost metagenome]
MINDCLEQRQLLQIGCYSQKVIWLYKQIKRKLSLHQRSKGRPKFDLLHLRPFRAKCAAVQSDATKVWICLQGLQLLMKMIRERINPPAYTGYNRPSLRQF